MAPKNCRRGKALVIGIENYGPQLGALKGIRKDAEGFLNLLGKLKLSLIVMV